MLVIAVCSDMFFTSFSYGRNGIRIPFSSSLAISLTGALILSFSLEFSEIIGRYIPGSVCVYGGALILFVIGFIYLFQNCIKERLKYLKNRPHQIEIIIDECQADSDNSKVLSLGEAMILSVSLSLDSLASGMGAGLSGTGVIKTGIMALVCGFAVMTAGEFAGRVLKVKSGRNFSWIGGAALIILAVIKIIP